MDAKKGLELPATKRRADRPCGRKALCAVCDRLKARGYYRRNRDRVLARQSAQRTKALSAP